MGRISAYLTLTIILCCGVLPGAALAALKQPDISRMEHTPTYEELKIELRTVVRNLEAELHTSASIKLRAQLSSQAAEMIRLEGVYDQARKTGTATTQELDAIVDAYATCVDGISRSYRDLSVVMLPHRQQIDTVLNKLIGIDYKRAQREQEELGQLLQPLVHELALEPRAIQAYVTVINLRQIAVEMRESRGEAITVAIRWQELITTIRDYLNRNFNK